MVKYMVITEEVERGDVPTECTVGSFGDDIQTAQRFYATCLKRMKANCYLVLVIESNVD